MCKGNTNKFNFQIKVYFIKKYILLITFFIFQFLLKDQKENETKELKLAEHTDFGSAIPIAPFRVWGKQKQFFD